MFNEYKDYSHFSLFSIFYCLLFPVLLGQIVTSSSRDLSTLPRNGKGKMGLPLKSSGALFMTLVGVDFAVHGGSLVFVR